MGHFTSEILCGILQILPKKKKNLVKCHMSRIHINKFQNYIILQFFKSKIYKIQIF